MSTLGDILHKDRKIEIFFDLINIDVEYCFRIKNAINSELKKKDNYRYIILDCKSYQKLPGMNIGDTEEFLLNFPERAFVHAMDRYPQKIRLEDGDDLFVAFKRLTKKKIKFIKLEIIKKDDKNGTEQHT